MVQDRGGDGAGAGRAVGEGLKQAIFDEALRLLESEGFSGLSTRKIASRVGCTATSIYLYFDNKDALVHALIAEGFERMDERLTRAHSAVTESGGDPRAAIRAGADEIDGAFQMIKGGGGALLREKVVASASHAMIAVVGANKGVERRGTTVDLPVEVPVINRVAAGYPTEFTDLGYPARVADEYVRCPDIHDPDAFAARVVGDSMEPDYREGDIVIFSPAKDVRDGSDCFARLEPDQETTFKRVYLEKDDAGAEVIRLQPMNNRYSPRVVPRERVAGLSAAASVVRPVP